MLRTFYFLLTTIIIGFFSCCSIASASHPDRIPILTYHNFDPSIPGSMTISTEKFRMQLQWLKEHGYTVIPLKELVAYLQGKMSSLPPKPVVITADDGRKSVYTYMYPLVRQYNIPVTLFVYPSAISKASYALTWGQLKEMQQTGLFDIQSHTYWHPNFKQDKKTLSAAQYETFVHNQLINSKKVLEEKLDTHITLLAWPYGYYDHYLEQEAAKAGYTMAFSIDDRKAKKTENMMAEPRYMVVGAWGMKAFAEMVTAALP